MIEFLFGIWFGALVMTLVFAWLVRDLKPSAIEDSRTSEQIRRLHDADVWG